MTTSRIAPGNGKTDLNQLEKDLQDAVTLNSAAAAGKAGDKEGSASQSSSEVPEKFKGKSFDDVIGMYTELHSQYGRMANDLGTQRKLTDRLLDLKRTDDLARNSGSQLPVIKSDELLDHPAQTIDKIVESRLADERKILNDRLGQLEAGLAQERFVSKHPDYQKVAESAGFVAWVKDSPYRSRIAAAAANGDFGAADEIISEYKSTQVRSAAQGGGSADDNLEKARKAALEGGNSGDGKASSGKVYRRADLIRLKIERPRMYSDPQFQEEIMKAYAEGRVK